MRTRHTRIVTALLGSACLFGAAALGTAGQQDPDEGQRQESDVDVTIERQPKQRLLVTDVRGSYDKHPQAISALFMYLGMNRIEPKGNIVGIYHNDPNVTPEAQLRWQIGVPVGEEVDATDPYRIEILEETRAAVYRSTVNRVSSDGEKAHEWLRENGWAPSGPVRMEYLDQNPDPTRMRVRVIMPVQRAGVAPASDDGHSLDDVAFLAGEWRAEVGDDVLIERWSEPVADTMVASFVWIRPEGAWMYELISIQQREDGVLFQLRHFGRDFDPWEGPDEPVRMRLAEAEERKATFENLDAANSFRRMIFHRGSDDLMTVTLEPAPDSGESKRTFKFRRTGD